MSFHGGLLGVMAALALFARTRGRPFLEVTDLVAPCVPTGLACRAASATSSTASCGAASPTRRCRGRWCSRSRAAPLPRHPSQLYQFALEGLLLFVAAVDLRAQAARARPGVGRLPRRLRRVPLHRRVLPRARRLPRPAGARHEHGPVAVRADDRRRHRAVAWGRGRAPGDATGCRWRRGRPEEVERMRQIFLDTETTGLSPESGDRIIEIGCVEMRQPAAHRPQPPLLPQPRAAQPRGRGQGARPDRRVPRRQAAVRADRRRAARVPEGRRDHHPQRRLRRRLPQRRTAPPRAAGVHQPRGRIIDSLSMAREMLPGQVELARRPVQAPRGRQRQPRAARRAARRRPAGRGLHPHDARPELARHRRRRRRSPPTSRRGRSISARSS